jgi:hypothetical protein
MLSFVGRGSTSSDTRMTDVFSRLPADLEKKTSQRLGGNQALPYGSALMFLCLL